MAKLNQIIAIESGVKSKAKTELDNLYKTVQKADLFSGHAKVYQPEDEEGEKLPADNKKVQLLAPMVLTTLAALNTEAMQIVARKDWTNQLAKASVVIDEQVILKDVPVSYLLFLEKNITDVRSVIDKLPVLDVADDWKYDSGSGLYKTDPVQTHRTKKTVKVLVKYPATPEHPAQTDLIQEDVIAGYWTTIKQSGAMTKNDKDALLKKVDIFLKAVKLAREEANMQAEVQVPQIAESVFGYILGKE